MSAPAAQSHARCIGPRHRRGIEEKKNMGNCIKQPATHAGSPAQGRNGTGMTAEIRGERDQGGQVHPASINCLVNCRLQPANSSRDIESMDTRLCSEAQTQPAICQCNALHACTHATARSQRLAVMGPALTSARLPSLARVAQNSKESIQFREQDFQFVSQTTGG